jgi:hypothetical protein
VEHKRNAWESSVRKTDGKIPLGGSRRRREGTKMDHKEVG